MIRELLEELQSLVETGEGAEKLRELERAVQTSPGDRVAADRLFRELIRRGADQAAIDRFLLDRLRHGEKPETKTGDRRVERRDAEGKVTVVSLRGVDLAKAEWTIYPKAWPGIPGPEVTVDAIFVRPGFDEPLRALRSPHDKSAEDMLVATVGRLTPSYTQHPFRGSVQPLA